MPLVRRVTFCLARAMSDLRIRCATPCDIDDVLRLRRTAAKGASISDDHDGVARLLERDLEAPLLAERVDVLVGTVTAGFDGWRCSVHRLAVHPERRRRGIVTALLAAEERFAGPGGRRADAMVLEADEGAHRTWASAGYHREDHWRRRVRPLRPGTGNGGPTREPHP